jgi:predicted DNA-binding protein (MmcQ/YjbR family)
MTSSRDAAEVLEHLRAIVSTLPDATETLTWGHPNWRVGGAKGKLFLGWGGEGRGVLGFKSDPRRRDDLLTDPRFTIAPYVGKYGWLSLDLNQGRLDWKEIAALVRTSYEQIAPAPKPAKKPAARRRG